MSNFFLGWHYKNKYKGDKNKEEILVNPLTPMSDQDRISPYNINTISFRQAMRIKQNIN